MLPLAEFCIRGLGICCWKVEVAPQDLRGQLQPCPRLCRWPLWLVQPASWHSAPPFPSHWGGWAPSVQRRDKAPSDGDRSRPGSSHLPREASRDQRVLCTARPMRDPCPEELLSVQSPPLASSPASALGLLHPTPCPPGLSQPHNMLLFAGPSCSPTVRVWPCGGRSGPARHTALSSVLTGASGEQLPGFRTTSQPALQIPPRPTSPSCPAPPSPQVMLLWQEEPLRPPEGSAPERPPQP